MYLDIMFVKCQLDFFWFSTMGIVFSNFFFFLLMGLTCLLLIITIYLSLFSNIDDVSSLPCVSGNTYLRCISNYSIILIKLNIPF